MEAVIETIDAELLIPILNIPAEMRKKRVTVTVEPLEDAEETMPRLGKKPRVNQEIMAKFRAAAEAGEGIAHLKKKLAEGYRFKFDAQKIIDGKMTEDDWQEFQKICKQAWPEAAAEKAKRWGL